jgi:hypothetical protein
MAGLKRLRPGGLSRVQMERLRAVVGRGASLGRQLGGSVFRRDPMHHGRIIPRVGSETAPVLSKHGTVDVSLAEGQRTLGYQDSNLD